MGTTVVLEGVMASELPEAWRQRVKAKGNEVLTVTIAKRKNCKTLLTRPETSL